MSVISLIKQEKKEICRLDISKYVGKKDPFFVIFFQPSVSDFLSIQNFFSDHADEKYAIVNNLFAISRIAKLEDGSSFCESNEQAINELLDNITDFNLIIDLNECLKPAYPTLFPDFTAEKKS